MSCPPARDRRGARCRNVLSVRSTVFVCLAALVASCGRDPEASAGRYMAHGDEYMAVGRYDAAAIDYRSAIKSMPNRLEAYLKLAEAQQLAGKGIEAYETFTRASDLAPRDARPPVGAGRVLLAGGRPGEAETRARAALERDPSNVDARVLLGTSLVRQSRWSPAESVLSDVVASVPQSVPARVALADLLIATERDAAAGAELQAALAANPDDELANRALAAWYLSAGRTADAEPLLVAAAAHTTQRYQSSLALADYYTAAGRIDDARRALDAAPKQSGMAKPVKARQEALSVY